MNWWEELELETETEKRLQAEVKRLRAVNAGLLAACEEVVKWRLPMVLLELIERAVADAKGQPDQPTGWKLPGLE